MQFSMLQRLGLWIVAVTSLVTAFLLLMWAGLPERSDFSGFVIDGFGYVAPEIGEIAPPINADLLSGESLHLDDLRGETLIINFWATWCVPCAIEMPELQALHEEMAIRILGINIAEPQAAISAWVDYYQLTFDIVLDPQQIIYRDYRIIGQPTTFVVTPNGIISHIFYGATSAEALQAAINTHDDNG